MITEKKCKGRGVSLGHGCGKLTHVSNLVQGLGKMCGCYSDWLLNSENGRIKLEKARIKVSAPRIAKEKATIEHEMNTKLKASHQNTKVQVHSFVRERDKNKPCISCGCDYDETFQACHYYKSETFTTLKYNLDNINSGCVRCNLFLDGNFDNYTLMLPKRIGQERFDALTKLAEIDKHFEKVWNLENLKEIRDNLKTKKT